MSLFEKATRHQFRFSSVRGELLTENLWQLPLTSKNGMDLDTIAKAVNADLMKVSEESFVQKTSPQKAVLEDKLAVLKRIIDVKQQEAKEAEERTTKNQQKQRLLAALERKQETDLENLSTEELAERLAKLEE